MKTYQKLAIQNIDDFIYGQCPHPVELPNGLIIGGGEVFPEVNFTLPGMQINAYSMPEVCDLYREMIDGVCKRAVELHAPALVVEFELLPELTITPQWGAQVTAILRTTLNDYEQKHDLKTALRVTPNDIREFERPPRLRQGAYVDSMFESFELCAQSGAHLLAIESTGGKEIHDDAILQGDLAMSVFALGVLGARDMAFLWDRITEISQRQQVVPAGDSACGFANTAMVLAEQRYIPRVWAALIRVMAAPRSLVAFEHGAIGPNKDCAYEGVYLKAITGCPIALEGAEAACAHLSPIGNISKAVADLWSNESVQHIKLLGGMAPVVSVEQLVYATRLLNTAAADGPQAAGQMRDWLSRSDAGLDPQAYVLQPDVALLLAGEMIKDDHPYLRTRRTVLATLDVLRKAHTEQHFSLSKIEQRWLDRLSKQAENLPDDEQDFIQQVLPIIAGEKVRLQDYAL